MRPDEIELLDRLFSDGPMVMFWTEVRHPGTAADPARDQYISPSIEAVFGYRREQVAGPSFWLDCIHPDDVAEVGARRRHAVETGAWPTHATYRFRHADGSYRWVRSTVNLVPGPPDRLIGLVSDVTEQVEQDAQVRERERQLTHMFDGAPAQVYAKALDGRYLFCNRDVLRLWGMTADEVIGKTDHDLWPEFADEYRANDRNVAEAGVPVLTDEIITLDDGVHTYMSLKFPLRDDDGRIYATGGVSADITDRAREVGDLQSAAIEADRANRSKSEFLSRMSHELRTPLNSIVGFAQLLELGASTEDDLDSARQILRASRHLVGLIDEVLDIAKIEAGRLSLSMEAVDLGEVIDEAIAIVAAVADARGITIAVHAEGGPWNVLADRQRTLQVLLNLLSNAVKYNHEGGSIAVALSRASAAERTRLVVADDGPGIDPVHHERIFEAFERLPGTDPEIEGSGVGLALTRHLVKVMDGAIGVDSSPGEGASFWVELGTAEQIDVDAAVPTAALVPEPADEGAPLTVLYIEDNAANLRLVERVLALRPAVELSTAMTGRMGLDLAMQRSFDLVLLDLHLPDMTGLDVLERLRTHDATVAMPIVVISADATPRQQEHARRSGATGYLTKPIDVNELLALVDDLRR